MAILGALLALVARPHAARFARERPYVRSTLLSPWSWRLSRANWSCATYTSARLNGCRPMMNLARLPDPRLGWVLGNGAHRAQDNRRARHRLLYRPSRGPVRKRTIKHAKGVWRLKSTDKRVGRGTPRLMATSRGGTPLAIRFFADLIICLFRPPLRPGWRATSRPARVLSMPVPFPPG
jgi:hypothetical protein